MPAWLLCVPWLGFASYRYEAALDRAGFVNASVLWSRFGFVTWLAYKPAR